MSDYIGQDAGVEWEVEEILTHRWEWFTPPFDQMEPEWHDLGDPEDLPQPQGSGYLAIRGLLRPTQFPRHKSSVPQLDSQSSCLDLPIAICKYLLSCDVLRLHSLSLSTLPSVLIP
jgi:hypothetical protein